MPPKDLVIVTTSRSDVSRERRDHLDSIYSVAAQIVATRAIPYDLPQDAED